MFKVISHLRIFLRFNGAKQKISSESEEKTPPSSNEAANGKSRLKRYSN